MARFVTLTNLNSNTDSTVEIHREGCRDIAHLVAAGWENNGAAEYANRWEAYLDYNADFYAEGGRENCWHIDFKGCCRSLKNGTWPSEYKVRAN